MNSLPDDQSSASSQPGQAAQGSSVGIAKEVEPIVPSRETGGIKEIGQDVELPKEVSAAGVKVHPTTVSVPSPVTQLGVQPVGTAAATQTPAASLPLTDEKIAKGLTQSIANSVRWLAEWCKKRLKQLRLTS